MDVRSLFTRFPLQRRYGLYLLPFILAVLSKPPAAVFPLLLLFYVFFFESADQPLGSRWRMSFLAALPSVVVTALLLWLVVIVLVSVVLSMTTFGRRTYAIGNSPRASFLAGVDVTTCTIGLYALSGLFSALAGIVLVGYGGQAALGMGDPYLFQSIAAVVIGGASILGGRGNYIGSAAGAISLVTLVSVLMAMNMPEYGRSIIYGVIILVLLLLYGREDAER